MDKTILVLDITGAHLQAAAIVDGVAYAAGDPIALHFSDVEYSTRPDDVDPTITYEPRLDGKITIDRSALQSGDGQPIRVGGMAMPKLSRISIANGDGRLNWMRLLSLDGAVATLREIPLEQDPAFAGRLRPVLQSDPAVITWFAGACAGEPAVKLDKTVELELVDRFDDRLRKPVQTAKYLGLGGRLNVTAAAASVTHDALLNVNTFSLILLLSHTGAAIDRAVVTKNLMDVVGVPFFLRIRTDGRFSARVNTATGSTLLDTSASPAAGVYWVALTYDGTTAALRCYTPEGVRIEDVTGARSGTTLTNSVALVFGSSPGAGSNFHAGSLSEIRLYSRALTSTEITASFHQLDLDEAGDINGLVGYWPCNERTGTYLRDKSGNKLDAILTGTYTWGSTLTGEAAQRGQYLPLVLGPLQVVPLAKVDEALEIWAASATSAQQVLRVYNSKLEGLTPTYAVSGGWVLSSTLNTLERTGGANLTTWVPGMSVTLGAGWTTNAAKVLTVTELISLTRVAISGTGLANETVAAGLVTANSPQWAPYTAGGGNGQYVQMLADIAQPPVAWVNGENLLGFSSKLGAQLRWLLTESQAALDYDTELTDATRARIEETGTGDYAELLLQEAAAVYIPPGPPVRLYDVLERILKATGLHLLGIGAQVEIGAVELEPAATVAVVDEEVEDLDVTGLKAPPPAMFKTLYRDPPYRPPEDSISAGSIPAVAELVRAGGVVLELPSTIPNYSTIWPSGADEVAEGEQVAEWSPMQTRAGAERVVAQQRLLSSARAWRSRVLVDVGNLLPGTGINVQAGPASAESEQLYGLEAGVDAAVVGSSYEVLSRRYTVTVLIPVQDL